MSQLPFGWVCFSNAPQTHTARVWAISRLNCLSAGSVSLTFIREAIAEKLRRSVSIAFRLGLFL